MRRTVSIVGVVISAIAGMASSSALAAKATPRASECAFRAAVPCPIPRARIFNMYGPYVAVSTRSRTFDLEIRDFTGVPDKRALRRLRARRGANIAVSVGPATRIFIVRPDHSRARVKRKALFTALSSYERAPVYVSGVLQRASYWNDNRAKLKATLITLDLSDGAIANLSGEWLVREDPNLRVSLVVAPQGLRRYTGDVRAADGRRVATLKVSQPTTGTVCITDWVDVAGSGVPEHYDCGTISGNGRILGPMAPRTPGRLPVTLARG